ncbi:hypothetical protein B0H13DRAFT_1887789 [Mycena leptocephala]|nr:hypothetical protein B0H13DRAFT_1887789 [Mycena leptocephala]
MSGSEDNVLYIDQSGEQAIELRRDLLGIELSHRPIGNFTGSCAFGIIRTLFPGTSGVAEPSFIELAHKPMIYLSTFRDVQCSLSQIRPMGLTAFEVWLAVFTDFPARTACVFKGSSAVVAEGGLLRLVLLEWTIFGAKFDCSFAFVVTGRGLASVWRSTVG